DRGQVGRHHEVVEGADRDEEELGGGPVNSRVVSRSHRVSAGRGVGHLCDAGVGRLVAGALGRDGEPGRRRAVAQIVAEAVETVDPVGGGGRTGADDVAAGVHGDVVEGGACNGQVLARRRVDSAVIRDRHRVVGPTRVGEGVSTGVGVVVAEAGGRDGEQRRRRRVAEVVAVLVEALDLVGGGAGAGHYGGAAAVEGDVIEPT